MAVFLGGGTGSTNAKQTPRYTQIQLQTSAQGLPVAIGWGTNRLSPNLIWYGDFQAHKAKGSKGGGKGGEGGKGGAANYTYSAAVAMGLCEGPLTEIGGVYIKTVWIEQAQTTTLAKLNLEVEIGTVGQATWSFLTDNFPAQAIPYSSLAYVHSDKYALGSAPSLPNHSFECYLKFAGSYMDASSEPILDANPADIIEDFLTNSQYSINLLGIPYDSGMLADYRTYCAAQGIFLSPLLGSQEQVSSIIDRWASLTNTLIFFSEGKLKFVPLGDAAIINTGLSTPVTYTPDLTVQYDLTYDDYIDTGGNGNPAAPITVTRLDPADAPNHVKLEVLDRSNAYNPTSVEWQDQGLVDQFGEIDSPVSQAHEICDLAIATAVTQLIGQRLGYQRNTYAFTLGVEFSLLEPGDILTLTDPHIGLFRQPVRIKTIDEDEQFQLAITAEELPGSLGAAFVGSVQGSAGGGNGQDIFVDPGLVNPPAIFEPNTALTGGQAQIWIAVSGGANWASAVVMLSFDGTNYVTAGYIGSPAPQGTLTASLANHADPDTVDTLAVDMSESLQPLSTDVTHDDADQGRSLALLTAAYSVSGMSATVPNGGELLAYGEISATGTYTANATYLRRGDYGIGPDTFLTEDFFTRILLNETQPPINSVLIYNLPSQYIGKTVHFKFLSMNAFGNNADGFGPQDPSDTVDYSYTVTGRGYGSGGGGVPSQPTGMTATGVTGGIFCTWNANPSSDHVTSYTLYRDSTPIPVGLVTAYTDSPLAAGVDHTYTVEATNAAGTSIASAGSTAAAL